MAITYKFIKAQISKELLGENSLYLSLVNDQNETSKACLALIGANRLERFKALTKFKVKAGACASMAMEIDASLVQLTLLGVDELSKLKGDGFLKLGGDIYKISKKYEDVIIDLSALALSEIALKNIVLGIELASYEFNKYLVKKAKKDEPALEQNLTIIAEQDISSDIIEEAKIIADSVKLTRNLVNEPANILTTSEFKNRIMALTQLGVEVTILEKAQLEELKMQALLGVAQGSSCPPYVAIMQWKGDTTKDKVVLVGKGVVFDSGGISIKPAASMEEMKGDMGGAAAVVGTLHCLAKRKSKANVVGIVGLVENMVDACAQRPGDVVTSMSGQTIEIVNTDAEGRLVLADILYYAAKNFSPKIMIDLATLTGAVLIALGNIKAGMFCDNEELADNLLEAAKTTGEQLWHLPLCEEYDKLVDSKIADMRNSAGRLAASSTAAQFLNRFVGDVTWAHLDIAGTAFGAPKLSYCNSWASGFGVRLLNELIVRNYE